MPQLFKSAPASFDGSVPMLPIPTPSFGKSRFPSAAPDSFNVHSSLRPASRLQMPTRATYGAIKEIDEQNQSSGFRPPPFLAGTSQNPFAISAEDHQGTRFNLDIFNPQLSISSKDGNTSFGVMPTQAFLNVPLGSRGAGRVFGDWGQDPMVGISFTTDASVQPKNTYDRVDELFGNRTSPGPTAWTMGELPGAGSGSPPLVIDTSQVDMPTTPQEILAPSAREFADEYLQKVMDAQTDSDFFRVGSGV